MVVNGVVYDYAKILNLKQFTTILFLILGLKCCLWLCKDTKFKAIHNNPYLMMQHGGVVYDYAKILNLKQFTTTTWWLCLQQQLSMTMQRY